MGMPFSAHAARSLWTTRTTAALFEASLCSALLRSGDHGAWADEDAAGEDDDCDCVLVDFCGCSGEGMGVMRGTTWGTGAAASQCVNPRGVRQFGGL